MDYMANNDEDIFDLKVEDHSAHYLFNSLLEVEGHHEVEGMGEFFKVEPPPAYPSYQPLDHKHIISEL